MTISKSLSSEGLFTAHRQGRLSFMMAGAVALFGFGALLATPAEAQGFGQRGQDRLQAIDTDGDGAISRAESEAAHAERFAKADSNGDGVITFAEFDAQMKRGKADRKQAMFDRLDTDGSGEVTKAELSASNAARFDQGDLNGDGLITAEERATMREEFKARRSEGGGLRP